MDIKVNGKDLFDLSKEELIQADKEIKMAYLQVEQKDNNKFRIGDRVRVDQRGEIIEGVVETISSKSLGVKVGKKQVIVSPRKAELLS